MRRKNKNLREGRMQKGGRNRRFTEPPENLRPIDSPPKNHNDLKNLREKDHYLDTVVENKIRAIVIEEINERILENSSKTILDKGEKIKARFEELKKSLDDGEKICGLFWNLETWNQRAYVYGQLSDVYLTWDGKGLVYQSLMDKNFDCFYPVKQPQDYVLNG